MSVRHLLDKMEAAEEAFLKAKFLAPVLARGSVRVRIAGVICTLRVVGDPQPGWAILKPLALDRARVVARPSHVQIREYLELFPAVRLILARHTQGCWLGTAARAGDSRLRIEGPVPVYLVAGAEAFQQTIARFDGQSFWFQEVDRHRNPAVAAYLREALAAETPPTALHKPTLTAEERNTYGWVYGALEAARRDRQEERLREALAHAGAEMTSYVERDDSYTVSYTVDGRPYRSTVRRDDLTVLAAGICLEGEDQSFDLSSLVGVLREAERGRRLVRVGLEAHE
jgi:hypothetical protein